MLKDGKVISGWKRCDFERGSTSNPLLVDK